MSEVKAYLELFQKHPELFSCVSAFPLVMDEERLRRFSEETGQNVGLVFENSPFFYVLADCIEQNGHLFRYARIVSCHHPYDGVVVIPTQGEKLGLIEICRHALRQQQPSLEFVRGYAEHMTPQENAAKELQEEIFSIVSPEKFEFVGKLIPNTGLSGGKVLLFTVEIEDAFVPEGNTEGIQRLLWLTEDDFRRAAAENRITCGITLAAYLKFLLWKGGRQQ